MTQWGAKKGVKKPTIEEIEYAKVLIKFAIIIIDNYKSVC